MSGFTLNTCLNVLILAISAICILYLLGVSAMVDDNN